MEKSFDFGALLKNHEKKHKSKPSQFASVAGGTKKRVEIITKHRKSSRSTIFDSIRNLPQTSRCNSPAPISEGKQKVEHRRQQLEKWKEEKERKKKELAAMKKKPFVAGVPHNPLKYVPPPPPPKQVPSTSGRVTRSQTAKSKAEAKEPKQPQTQSFAPKNAVFRAPHIKNLTKLPNLAPPKTKDKTVLKITFEPVTHNKAQTEVKQTRSRTLNKIAVNSRVTRSVNVDVKPKGKNSKTIQKAPPLYFQSSSSSENEHPTQMQTSSSSDVDLTAKMLSSSSENSNKFHSSSTESAKSLQSSSSSELETVEIEKKLPVLNKSRKSLSAVSTPRPKTPQKSSRTPKPYLTEQNEKIVTPKNPVKQNENFLTPKNPVPKSESSSEERLRSPKIRSNVNRTPVDSQDNRISPCVTISRGKDNARKEMKKKLDEGLLDEDSSNIEIGHFRRQLSSEIKRITEMCETWDKIYEQVALPENVQELVLGCVGQARLLMSQKLQQFASLVERCARPDPAAALVTPADLHGFWDMVFMQVENVDIRFKRLEELKARGWVEEAPAPVARKPKPVVKPIKPAVKPKAGGNSRLKEMIAAARAAKKQDAAPTTPTADKTFEAGFFTVRSPCTPARSPCTSARSPCTPASKHNLLKAVLSSEAKKASASRNSASFAMLRASVLGKNIDCEGVAPLPQTPLLPQVNLHSTPGRSILKQPRDSTSKMCNKVVKVVLFNQSFTDINDNTQQDTNTTTQPDTNTTTQPDTNTTAQPDTNTTTQPDTNTTTQPDTNTTTQPDTDTENQPIVSAMDIEDSTKKNKENSRRKPRLTRQDAVDHSPVMTRSRRRSMQTPQTEEKPRRRSAKKVLEEVKMNVEENQTPRRSTRSRKSSLYCD